MELLALLLCSMAVALTVHEGAHALSAWALGGREIRVRLRGVRVEVEATLEGGWQQVLFTLAGAGANVVTGLALALPAWGGGVRIVGIMSLLLALTSLIPAGSSDGARALALWRRGG